MNIVHLTNTDPAGAVYNFIRAMNEHTKHRVRLIATQTITNFDFPKDIHDLFDSGDEVEALLTKADVIHFHKIDETFTFEFNLSRGVRQFNLKDYVKGKKIVYHIHGSPTERSMIQETAEVYSKGDSFVLTATPDLEAMYKPHLKRVMYFPNIVPINDVRYLPRATDDPITGEDGETKRLCLFQSGTHSILKNMHVIRDVMERVSKDLPIFFLHTSPESIQPQDFALRHKRIAHIVFDHMEGYYGLSSLEGLSMGKPTIAGLNTITQDAICKFFGVDVPALPWVHAENENQLETEIRKLVADEQLRKSIGQKSRKFMEEVWSDAAVAKRMGEFYSSL